MDFQKLGKGIICLGLVFVLLSGIYYLSNIERHRQITDLGAALSAWEDNMTKEYNRKKAMKYMGGSAVVVAIGFIVLQSARKKPEE